MDRTKLTELIEGSDLDGLVRFVDNLVREREWLAIIEVRDRCEAAVERGKQVWAPAQYAEYRLALDAPGEFAGPVVVDGAGRLAPGPLWEVAASTHTWDQLAGHIPHGPARTLAACERALSGDKVVIDDSIDTVVLGIPLFPEPWEAGYPAPVYRSDGADFPEPPSVLLAPVDLGEPGTPFDDEVTTDALYALARPWVEDSSGHCEVVAVEGTATSAIRLLGPHTVTIAQVDLATALAAMTWAGASGGAYGRRRGRSTGRAAAWWTVAAMAGVEDDWPFSEGEAFRTAGESIRWWLWDPGDITSGWRLHLAAELESEGIAWAIGAVDALLDEV